MKKFVLDTNVLLHDAEALTKFDEHIVIIPMVVLEELDRFKKEQNERGQNARAVNRILDNMRSTGRLDEDTGVKTGRGGTLFVDTKTYTPADVGMEDSADAKILCCAKRHSAILVTKDINLRVKADALYVEAEDYKNDKILSSEDEMYKGHREVICSPEVIGAVARTGIIASALGTFYENEYITLVNETNEYNTLLCKASNGTIKKLAKLPKTDGISPRNREQQFALDMLMDDNIKLCTISGLAGSGKSLIAIAAGLSQVGREYKKLLVYRPVVPMGNDIGFLPGTMEEKLAPWMQPIDDAINYIMRSYDVEDDIPEKTAARKRKPPQMKKVGPMQKVSAVDELKMQGLLETGALTYIRGRSIPKQYILIDEAQNCSKHELKTLITRAGEGTKIVLTGDYSQIDNPYLDMFSNGFSQTVESFRGVGLYGHVHLTKCERSELADLASKLM